jgi:hypothetical protein
MLRVGIEIVLGPRPEQQSCYQEYYEYQKDTSEQAKMERKEREWWIDAARRARSEED